MKFYLTTLLILIFIHLSQGQDIPLNGSKSEFPNLKKESLQIETEVELYPNPAIDYLTITLKNSQLKNVNFEIYNIIGNKLNIELDMINSDSYKINVKEYHSGYYLLIIKDPISRFNKAFKFRKQ